MNIQTIKALRIFKARQVPVDGRNSILLDYLRDTLSDHAEAGLNNTHFALLNALMHRMKDFESNVQYICKPILKMANENYEQLHKIVLEEWVNPCKGSIYIPNVGLVLYWFERPQEVSDFAKAEECRGLGIFVLVSDEGLISDMVCVASRLEIEGDGTRKVMWDNPNWFGSQEKNTEFILTLYDSLLNTIAFLQYADTEKVILENGQKKKVLGETVVNSTGVRIKYIDSRWVREIVRLEGFQVRGHFRMQRYGKNNAERKLIYINPFEKKGYHRRALKDIQK